MTSVASLDSRRNVTIRTSETLFVTLVILLLVASSNVGLVNVKIAIKARDGGNLLGIRDALLALVTFGGMAGVLKQSKTALHNPLSKITFLVAGLTPIAALVGILYDGQVMTVARDSVTMMGWVMAYVVGTHLKTESALRRVYNAILWLGLLVALGVFIEAATLGHTRVVTPADVVTATGRSTPSGWPLMMMCAALVMTRLLLHRGAVTSLKYAFIDLFYLLIILVASLLTQSRTLLIGLATGFAVFLLMAMITRKRSVRRTGLILVLALIPFVTGMTLLLGERLIRTDFTDVFITRYSVLGSVDSLLQYSEEDTRRAEIELGLNRYAKSPLLGLGLGSPYREEMRLFFGQEDPAILVHNVFAFFLFRYGPIGLLLFSLLCVRFVISLYRAFHDATDRALYGIGLATGLINLVACSFFGSVFSSTYGVPVAMICAGTLIAYEEQRG